MNKKSLKQSVNILPPGLYEKHSHDIFKYSMSLLKNREEAEDAVQEVFLKFAESGGSFRQSCSIKTWLLVITRNYCYNRLKSKNYKSGGIEEEKEYGSYSHNFELRLTLEEALDKLSPEYNELLYLKEYEGYSYKEIAEITNQTVENVKIKLFRGRQILRKILSE
jgi:RNA polymerase sigma-70 factor (ECF subfamily)